MASPTTTHHKKGTVPSRCTSNNQNSKKASAKKVIDSINANSLRDPNPAGTAWTLLYKGYKKETHLTNTLQGSVYTVEMNSSSELASKKRFAVVKQSSKWLHRQQKAIGKKLQMMSNIQENIIREAQIMKTLNENPNVPPSMIRFLDFFEDNTSYYLVMENAGTSFFQFVVDCHALIKSGKLPLSQWQYQTQYMFAQMIHFHGWMHCQGFCNLDISMENILISNQCYYNNNDDNNDNNTMLHNCNIKFIDFGLSEYFPSRNFSCRKFVGKTYYKAPKVYAAKEAFDARKADVWSLAVVLFMMIFGCRPYNKPIMMDDSFRLISKCDIVRLIQTREPDKVQYCNVNQLDMLLKLLDINESRRPLTHDIVQHPWLSSFFIPQQTNYNNAVAVAVGASDTQTIYSVSPLQNSSPYLPLLQQQVNSNSISLLSMNSINNVTNTNVPQPVQYPVPVEQNRK